MARQTTLSGMPVVPAADKEKGKKKKFTARATRQILLSQRRRKKRHSQLMSQ
jgi:hypothetical protein